MKGEAEGDRGRVSKKKTIGKGKGNASCRTGMLKSKIKTCRIDSQVKNVEEGKMRG